MANDPSKQYWQSLEERDMDEAFLRTAADEFPAPVAPVDVSRRHGRRGFLKAAGFSIAGAVAAGCQRAPVTSAIPFLLKPEEVTPGQAVWYASTCGACSAACGVLVKTRDGRPIKLEGNPQHPLSRGGLCAVGQASVLELYDSRRYRAPLRKNQQASWEEIDRDVMAHLDAVRAQGGAVRLLTGTVTSPALNAAIDKFLASFPNARHVVYDALSSSAILDAHRRTHGRRVLPHYSFDRATVIVSVDADFLGTWIAPVEFTRAYREGRSLEGDPPRCSYHVQFEARLSVTGTKADQRARIAPDDSGPVLGRLAARIAQKAGAAFDAPRAVEGPALSAAEGPVAAALLDDVANRLWEARSASLVVSGSQDVAAQVLCNFINHLLDNYGRTIDIDRPSNQRQGHDAEIEGLVAELRAGSIAALLVAGANPAYDLPIGEEFAGLVKNVKLFVSFAGSPDETSALASHVCPDHHYLESWGDAEPVAGWASVTQPAIQPLANTRAALETLAAWTGDRRPAYDLVRGHWQTAIFARQTGVTSFQEFWDYAVHDGIAALPVAPPQAAAGSPKGLRYDTSGSPEGLRYGISGSPEGLRYGISGSPEGLRYGMSGSPEGLRYGAVSGATPAGALTLVLYPKVGMLDGKHAHNPWLQELPDPISKATWDNYACLSPATAARLNLREGDVVRLEAAADGPSTALGVAVTLPVYVQPGQHDEVVAVALGYGRAGTDRFKEIGPRWIDAQPGVGDNGLVGANAAPFVVLRDGALRYHARRVTIAPTGSRLELATTQRHHSIMEPRRISSAGARLIVRETTVSRIRPQATGTRPLERGREDLWPSDHPYTGHRWGMVIDLNACTGCSACVVACQAENNIPVVGRDEVRRQREMHWLRIDRYFTDAGEDVDVVHQPMLCQHCANASCETVCPVLATVHSAEGLNQQVYNRCVGTRYCANNCPYKVRRFNWFTYARTDERENLVLNPDVTVRTRGIMEKCSLCVQRIQEAKIEAKRRGEPVQEGDVRTACAQSCPAQAIVFGDLNDAKSRIATLVEDGRHFQVLEDLNERPNVGYLAVVRNREPKGEATNG